MVCSLLPRWLRGLVRRAPRSGAGPAIDVAVSRTSDDLVIRVKGEAGVGSAGALLDRLLANAAGRPASVTLDLSELRSVSPLALGVLAAYRRGVVCAGGRVRLVAGLQPAVKEALARAELLHLFENATGAARGGRSDSVP
jgi:anti-anti-sigma factor